MPPRPSSKRNPQTPSLFGEALKANMTATTKLYPPHVVIKARAGVGKTTVMIEGMKYLKGMDLSILPSSQQQTIFDALKLSEFGQARTIGFVAFNKSIATALKDSVPRGTDAMTCHAMGFKAVVKNFTLKPKEEMNSYKSQDIISDLYDVDIKALRKTHNFVIKTATKLASLCKQNLVGWSYEARQLQNANDTVYWDKEINKLCEFYEILLQEEDTNKDFSQDVLDIVPHILHQSKDMVKYNYIDYDDMIWLPTVLNLGMFKYDLLMIDESQDLNRAQQELVKRAGSRLIFVGDDKQAIYGFAGADSESLNRLEKELAATKQGCIVLPLTVTRRCSKAVVAEAKHYVPDFEAHETNSEGSVCSDQYAPTSSDYQPKRNYRENVKDSDMVLCRANNPLIIQCFAFLKEGRKARIQGRDIGQNLINLIKGFKADTIPELVTAIEQWRNLELDVEQAKANPNEAKIISISDKAECLMLFLDGKQTISGVVQHIENIFTDEKSSGILLSSIHKAKGLEADNVWLLMPKGNETPHPKAKSKWQMEQEINCLYIAITRAKHKFIYVYE